MKVKRVEVDSRIKTVGLVADTHIPARAKALPPKLYRALDGAHLILHAGDLVDEMIISDLEAIAPVIAVAGNMDPPHLQQRLGRLKVIKIGDISIGLFHGDVAGHRANFDRTRELFGTEKLQAIVFGHLHEPLVKNHGGILYINPGSAVEPRRAPHPSCGLLSITNGALKGEIIYL